MDLVLYVIITPCQQSLVYSFIQLSEHISLLKVINFSAGYYVKSFIESHIVSCKLYRWSLI